MNAELPYYRFYPMPENCNHLHIVIVTVQGKYQYCSYLYDTYCSSTGFSLRSKTVALVTIPSRKYGNSYRARYLKNKTREVFHLPFLHIERNMSSFNNFYSTIHTCMYIILTVVTYKFINNNIIKASSVFKVEYP